MNVAKSKQQEQMSHDYDVKQNNVAVQQIKEQIEIKRAEEKTSLISFQEDLKRAHADHESDLKKWQIEMEMKGKYYTPNILKLQMLENVKDFFRNYSNYRDVQVSFVGDDHSKNIDMGGQILTHMFNSFDHMNDLVKVDKKQK